MINFDNIRKEDMKEHNQAWPKIPYHFYRILIIGNSVHGKTNSLFNFMRHQLYIDKNYLYAKEPYKAKYQLLIRKRESIVLNRSNDSKSFMEYSNDMCDVYKNIEENNPNKKRKILVCLMI